MSSAQERLANAMPDRPDDGTSGRVTVPRIAGKVWGQLGRIASKAGAQQAEVADVFQRGATGISPELNSTSGRFPDNASTSSPGLPPGGRDDLDALEKVDRAALLRRSEELGPIFTGIAHGEFYVVVMGLQRGRRILLDHSDSLQPVTLDIEALVPKGMLRQMRGADHVNYRRPIVRAAKAADPAAESAMFTRLAHHHVRQFVEDWGHDRPGLGRTHVGDGYEHAHRLDPRRRTGQPVGRATL